MKEHDIHTVFVLPSLSRPSFGFHVGWKLWKVLELCYDLQILTLPGVFTLYHWFFNPVITLLECNIIIESLPPSN